MGTQGLNLDLDEQGRPKVQFPLQASLGGGMPPVAPVLPSLSKPIQQQAQPIAAGAIPPVTASAPSPEEQRVTQTRAKLDKLESTPSATQGLWNKAGEYHKEHPGFMGRIAQVGAGILRGVDIAGETLAPGIAQNIPGSIINRNQQIASGQRELSEAEKEFQPVRTEEMAGKRLDQQQSIQDQKEAQQTSIETQKEGARATQQQEAETARQTHDDAQRQASQDHLDQSLANSNAQQQARFTEAEKARNEQFAHQQALLNQREAASTEKGDTSKREKVLTYWQPALDSAERINVMTKNYKDALENHDQQAMLSLLANHLGMTMGLQKGSRLTRDIIREAQQSRPWLQGLQAKFDKDGYLSGVTLTPMQMKQMVGLGVERYREDTKKARSMAGYIGVKDEPERQLSKETAKQYLDEAGGDANRARDLAKADGWKF